MAIFDGRVRVRYGYSCWGYTRGGGKTWHGGTDEEGLDSTTILMPGYKGKSISGKGLDPSAYTGHANAPGTYFDVPTADKQYKATVLVNGLRLRTYPEASSEYAQIDSLAKGKSYPVAQTRSKWAFLLTAEDAGGWACIEDAGGTYLAVSEV